MSEGYRKSEETGRQEPTFWAAPDLAKAGYPVFPIGPDKAPSVAGGFYAATTDISQLAAWIEEGRGHHNVAFATGLPSRVVVIDADTAEAYEKMRKKYGEPHVKTRRGGHWYFRHPQDGKIRSTALEAGLDCKADGGYVLAPPSKGRAWTAGIPDLGSLRKLPAELRPKRMAAAPEEEAGGMSGDEREWAAQAIAAHVSRIGQGSRHEHLTHLCGVLLSRGVGPGDAERILIDAWTRADSELAERAAHEVPNALRTTAGALAEGRATGVPKMEALTPGLYEELDKIFVWSVPADFGSFAGEHGARARRMPPTTPTPQAGPLGERIFIGKLIREGIEPPTFLEPDILLEGAVHWLFGASESGKTWLVLWMIKNRLEAGDRVLLLDKENGPEIVGERLELLGCDVEAIDEHLYYHEEPSLRITPDTVEAFTDYLDEVRPALVVFDSARGFLTSAGLEENSNDDLDVFYEALLKPIRTRKLTSAILDHIPHDGNHARGAGRKKDLTDVMWNVKCLLPFDEHRVGAVKLRREKGRRGAIPETATFSIGGDGAGGFVLRRSAGTIENEDDGGLTQSARRALDTLREFGAKGATYSEWLGACGLAKQTFIDAKKRLEQARKVAKSAHRYFADLGTDDPPDDDPPIRTSTTGSGTEEVRMRPVPENPDRNAENCKVRIGTDEVRMDKSVPRQSVGTGGTGGLRPRTSRTNVAGPDIGAKEIVEEFGRRGAGARKNLPVYLRGDTTLEVLTRSVLYGLDRSPETWQRHAAQVEEAARDAANHPIECECGACL